MDVTLLHNPGAGSGEPSGEALRALLSAHTVTYRSTKEKQLETVLENAGDLIVIGGGDGTVRKIFKRIYELGVRTPVLILPLGTMNNIARSLGTFEDPAELIGKLSSLKAAPFHFLRVKAPEVDEVFFESVGIGLWARYLRLAEEDPKKVDALSAGREGPERDFAPLARLSEDDPAVDLEITCGGQMLRDRYLLAEAMNIPTVGALMGFGTEDSMLAGNIQLALVPEIDRRALVEYFRMKSESGEATFPGFHRNCPGPVTISAWVDDYHLDDSPRSLIPPGRITVTVERVDVVISVLRPDQ